MTGAFSWAHASFYPKSRCLEELLTMSRRPFEEYEPEECSQITYMLDYERRSRPFDSLSPLSPLIDDVFDIFYRYGPLIPLSP